jgi:hypothetical protein
VIDLHRQLLPGLDDGAQNFRTSLTMMGAAGYRPRPGGFRAIDVRALFPAFGADAVQRISFFF